MDLEDLFRRHQREVFVYFLRTLEDQHLAEDLAQETFLRAYGSALLFRGEASLRTWLFAIARNVLVEHFRRRTPEVLMAPPERTHLPSSQERLEIEEALGTLSLTSREAIVLCDILGFAPQEAAESIGITPNAFRVRLHRARREFQEAFGHE